MRGAKPCLSADLTTHAVALYTLQAMKMGRRARRDGLSGAVMSEVSRDAVRGFLACLFPGLATHASTLFSVGLTTHASMAFS